MSAFELLLRKMGITFAIGFGVFFLAAAPDLINAFEQEDWTNLGSLGRAAAFGAVAAGARALVSLLTAFVPTDSGIGKNAVGKFKNEPPA